MRELFRTIDLVADTDATVLIRGERGTGKELVAAAVQRLSRRGAAAFLTIDCGALPHDLLASELFGHERGAFTGAIEKRPGLFAVAHGGTLFADEIGNLSMEGQAKLLRDRGARDPTCGSQGGDACRRPPDRGDEQGPQARGAGQHVHAGPLRPAGRDRAGGAIAPGPARGHSPAG